MLAAACAPRTQPSAPPVNPDDLISDGRLYEAIVFLKENPGYADAAGRTQRAEAMLSREVGSRVTQAKDLASKGRLAESIRLYREALKLDPRRSDLAETVASLNAELDSRRRGLFTVLNTQLEKKNYTEAHTTLLKLERLDPFHDEVGTRLNEVESQIAAQYSKSMEEGIALYRKREYQKALAVFNRVLRTWPAHPQAQNYKNRITELYAEAAKVSPKKSAARPPAGKTAAAPVPAEPAATSFDQITAVRLSEGQGYLARGENAKALERFNKALDLDPNNEAAQKGRQQAIAKIGKTTEDLFREGVNFYRNEQLDRAIERWNLVLLMDPAHDRAQKYLERAQRLLDKFREVTGGSGSG